MERLHLLLLPEGMADIHAPHVRNTLDPDLSGLCSGLRLVILRAHPVAVRRPSQSSRFHSICIFSPLDLHLGSFHIPSISPLPRRLFPFDV